MPYDRTKKYRKLKSMKCDDASDKEKSSCDKIPVAISPDEPMMNASEDSNCMEIARDDKDPAANVPTIEQKLVDGGLSVQCEKKRKLLECDDAKEKLTCAKIPVVISSDESMVNTSKDSHRMETSRDDDCLTSNVPTVELIGGEQVVFINDSLDFEHLSEASSSVEHDDSDDERLESSALSDAFTVAESCSDEHKNLREKLRDCAVKHAAHITHSFLNDLLGILRSEGHTELPKTAETLLHTERTKNSIRVMKSKKGTYGTYIYMGVEKKLRLQISNSDFKNTEIRVLVNVDGLPIYAHSPQQLWPILMQVLADGYYCKPFVVALYCGDSKPCSADEYMADFIEECTTLIKHGLLIDEIARSFKVAAFVCDTPARAFIKCCKTHTAFYACERCIVRGKTVNNRRVYRSVNCTLRTKDSFLEKLHPEHHIEDITSPLVKIPGFDPVRGVVLDYMHLLCCGCMKSLLTEKWLSTKKIKGKIGSQERKTLSELLLHLSAYIPVEFQRKQFDISNLANWKATQYRFFLLYAGIILREVLSPSLYQHFLLLFVACRILCCSSWALLSTDCAEAYLRQFFKEMSSLYGRESQVMNFHNLIHLADDVRYLQAPLTMYSSFPFENCLGNIKTLIRTPRNPVAQVFRRLSESESVSQLIRKIDVQSRSRVNRISENERENSTIEYSKISLGTMCVCTTAPDNIVKLKNGDIFQVARIFCSSENRNKMLMEGQALKMKGDAFKEPIRSSEVGIFKIGLPTTSSMNTFRISAIAEKCMLLPIRKRTYALTLLHT